jgi:hypothetical protein
MKKCESNTTIEIVIQYPLKRLAEVQNLTSNRAKVLAMKRSAKKKVSTICNAMK